MRRDLVVAGIVVLLIGIFLLMGANKTQTYTELIPVQVRRPFQVTKTTEWKVTWMTYTPEGLWGGTVGSSTFPSTFDYDWRAGQVFGGYSNWVGFSAEATIYVNRTGPVSFKIGSDDGSMLFLDGHQKIIDLWSGHSYYTKSTVVYMTPGKHTLLLQYYEATGYARVTFSADSDVLTWQETEYRDETEYQSVIRQSTVADQAMLAFGTLVTAMGLGVTVGGFALSSKVRGGAPPQPQSQPS
jgi:hypothetical protein